MPGNTPHVTEIKSQWNLRLSTSRIYPTCHGNQIQVKADVIHCQEIPHMSWKSNPGEIQACRLPENTPHVMEIKYGWNSRLSTARKYPTYHGNQIQVKSRLVDCQEIPHMSWKSNPGEIQACRLPGNTPDVTEIKSGWNSGWYIARKYPTCHRNQIQVKSRLVDCKEMPHMSQKSNPGEIVTCVSLESSQSLQCTTELEQYDIRSTVCIYNTKRGRMWELIIS